jgi:hypothetical protein
MNFVKLLHGVLKQRESTFSKTFEMPPQILFSGIKINEDIEGIYQCYNRNAGRTRYFLVEVRARKLKGFRAVVIVTLRVQTVGIG